MLEKLDALAAWMRKVGAKRASYKANDGDLELELGDEPRSLDDLPPLTDEQVIALRKEEHAAKERLLFAHAEGY